MSNVAQLKILFFRKRDVGFSALAFWALALVPRRRPVFSAPRPGLSTSLTGRPSGLPALPPTGKSQEPGTNGVEGSLSGSPPTPVEPEAQQEPFLTLVGWGWDVFVPQL